MNLVEFIPSQRILQGVCSVQRSGSGWRLTFSRQDYETRLGKTSRIILSEDADDEYILGLSASPDAYRGVSVCDERAFMLPRGLRVFKKISPGRYKLTVHEGGVLTVNLRERLS